MFTKNVHYNQDIEAAVLGACMLEKSAFARIYETVNKETFYFSGHKEVFESLHTMYERGTPIDLFTVTDHVIRQRRIEELQGWGAGYFITTLTNSVVSSAHIEYHCYLLRSMWMEREILTLTLSGSPAGDVRQKVTTLQNKLHEISMKAVKSEWKDMSTLMVELYQHQEEMKKTGGMGLPSGLKKLDQKNGGFHPGNLIIIAARPSVGKSALAGQMAIEIAKQGKKVGFISLEMSNTEIAARLASIDTDTDFNTIYRGLYRDEQQKHRVYSRIASHTSELTIFASDDTAVNVNEIRAKAAKLKHKHGLDILFIDYLQLVQGDEYNSRNRENEVAKISRGAKIMARELEIPVVELCQMNREITKRKGDSRYPQLSDLRESGAIEQDADIVMFLHSDYLSGITTDENGYTTEGKFDLVVRKWRNGVANWVVPLDFDGPTMKFSERNEGFSNLTPVFYNEQNEKDPPF